VEQVGPERSLDLKESTTLVHGGSLEDTLYKSETVIFAEAKLLSETASRAESLIITNV